MRVALAVTPRAAADAVGPWSNDVLRVRVTRPPVDGDANRAVLRLVAAALGVTPGRVALVAGTRGRRKWVEVSGVSDAELRRRLARLAG